MHFEWVDKHDRMPTTKDADASGAILAWHEYSGVHITNPMMFQMYGTHLTHWAKTPERPEENQNEH